MKNRGYATVEACLVVPLFLFFFLAVGGLAMALLAEAHIHQSLAAAADDTALYGYLKKKTGVGNQTGYVVDAGILTKQFNTYLGADVNVENAVRNGKKGIIISIIPDKQNRKIFVARADFWVGFQVPLLGKQYIKMRVGVKKKAFVGYDAEENPGGGGTYVYITPNESVYHTSRNCSYLSLQIRQIGSGQKKGYRPCSFCGGNKTGNEEVYVAKTGTVYHTRKECSGLKRTVIRILLTEAAGLNPCQRCGG